MVVAGMVPRYLVVGEDVLIHRGVGSEPFSLFNNWELRHGGWEHIKLWDPVLLGTEELTRRDEFRCGRNRRWSRDSGFPSRKVIPEWCNVGK